MTAAVTVRQGADKRLNEMDRLADMTHFPAMVNAGATLNVLATITATWWVQWRYAALTTPLPWVALVLFVNLLPVVVLRRTITAATQYPTLRTMNFFRDQHKFSDWVYLAASANMAFWVLFAWTAASFERSGRNLIVLLAVAFVSTFSPVLLRSVWNADGRS